MNGIFQKVAVKKDDELYLDTLVTHPSSRKLGIATSLVEHTISYNGYTTLVVEVFSKNENAIRFYEKNGPAENNFCWAIFLSILIMFKY